MIADRVAMASAASLKTGQSVQGAAGPAGAWDEHAPYLEWVAAREQAYVTSPGASINRSLRDLGEAGLVQLHGEVLQQAVDVTTLGIQAEELRAEPLSAAADARMAVLTRQADDLVAELLQFADKINGILQLERAPVPASKAAAPGEPPIVGNPAVLTPWVITVAIAGATVLLGWFIYNVTDYKKVAAGFDAGVRKARDGFESYERCTQETLAAGHDPKHCSGILKTIEKIAARPQQAGLSWWVVGGVAAVGAWWWYSKRGETA